VPPAKSAFVDIDCGWGYVCVLDTDGMVQCSAPEWTPPPLGPGILDFETQQLELCAIHADRSLECWALGTEVHEPSRMDPPPKGSFNELCKGAYFACAVAESGTPACWSQYGISDDLPIPTEPVHDISCGFAHACGLTDDGRILCWGDNSLGQGDVPY
jgi:hypothetical protein